jgi:hypothetical protein
LGPKLFSYFVKWEAAVATTHNPREPRLQRAKPSRDLRVHQSTWETIQGTICWACLLPRQGYCVQIHYRVLVWTPCIMHRCVISTMFGWCFWFFDRSFRDFS